MKECFVAYPSYPPSLAETVETFIQQVEDGGVVRVKGWKSLDTRGRFIIDPICEAIDSCDVFICDMTGLNFNVLFELGYAIAKNKRIWPLLDSTRDDTRRKYEDFSVLTTIGYQQYANNVELVKNFYNERPDEGEHTTIYEKTIEPHLHGSELQDILYLKSAIETTASIKLTNLIHNCLLNSTTDDPKEVRVQRMTYYVEHVYKAIGIVAHLLAEDQKNNELHNAKLSFVCGMAYGLGKPLLMLAHEPFTSPIDYRDLLAKHSTASECEQKAKSWLDDIEANYRLAKAKRDTYKSHKRSQSRLQRLSVGPYKAEDEQFDLKKYFVKTSVYTEATRAHNAVFIGRKGSGKTANFYALANHFYESRSCLVCLIKPQAYELDGVLDAIDSVMTRSERGYLIESVWKYLIYTELAVNVFSDLENRPLYYQRSESEEYFYRWCKDHQEIVHTDFTVRLESAIQSIQSEEMTGGSGEVRTKLSEMLHSKLMSNFRPILSSVLEEYKDVVVLVDNLDKSWDRSRRVQSLSDFLIGILRVSNVILEELRRTYGRTYDIDLRLLLFLRTDIYNSISEFIKEPDKVNLKYISWSDRATLLRVIEERFMASDVDFNTPDEVWNSLFCERVEGVPIKEYLLSSVLPKPRDLIYLISESISQAVNRGHAKVNEEDVREARENYSRYALDALTVENGFRVQNVAELLYEFAGSEEIVDEEVVFHAMNRARIHNATIQDVVSLLVDLSFLGPEVGSGKFHFLEDQLHKRKLSVMSNRLIEEQEAEAGRFRIHPAFHPYLEVKSLPS